MNTTAAIVQHDDTLASLDKKGSYLLYMDLGQEAHYFDAFFRLADRQIMLLVSLTVAAILFLLFRLRKKMQISPNFLPPNMTQLQAIQVATRHLDVYFGLGQWATFFAWVQAILYFHQLQVHLDLELGTSITDFPQNRNPDPIVFVVPLVRSRHGAEVPLEQLPASQEVV
ncbi:hypothetical protein FRC03_003260 [Tulasnella sp. 419]|nr:hypothetical protein FRC03_003260 [Tulasnella sp. 419]